MVMAAAAAVEMVMVVAPVMKTTPNRRPAGACSGGSPSYSYLLDPSLLYGGGLGATMEMDDGYMDE